MKDWFKHLYIYESFASITNSYPSFSVLISNGKNGGWGDDSGSIVFANMQEDLISIPKGQAWSQAVRDRGFQGSAAQSIYSSWPA